MKHLTPVVSLILGIALGSAMCGSEPVKEEPDIEKRILEIQSNQINSTKVLLDRLNEIEKKQELKPLLPEVRL
jgi:hypothetical protein